MDGYENVIAELDDVVVALQIVERFLLTKPNIETDYDRYFFEQDQLEKSAILTLAIDKLMTLQKQ